MPASGKEVKLPDGRDAQHKTYADALEDIKSRIAASKKSGNVAPVDRDLEVIIAFIEGRKDEDMPDQVVLTSSQERKNEIADLEAKLAAAKAA